MNRLHNNSIQKYLSLYSILKTNLLDIFYITRPSTVALIFGSISHPNIIYALHYQNCSKSKQLMQLLNIPMQQEKSKFTVLVWAQRGIESDLLKPKKFKFKNPIDIGNNVWNDDPDYIWYAVYDSLDACSSL